MKTYTVATFCDPGETRISNIHAYTLWYNPEWPGCIVYEIEAKSGKEAKRIAVKKRQTYEDYWGGSQHA